jgi:hypothetical protein
VRIIARDGDLCDPGAGALPRPTLPRRFGQAPRCVVRLGRRAPDRQRPPTVGALESGGLFPAGPGQRRRWARRRPPRRGGTAAALRAGAAGAGGRGARTVGAGRDDPAAAGGQDQPPAHLLPLRHRRPAAGGDRPGVGGPRRWRRSRRGRAVGGSPSTSPVAGRPPAPRPNWRSRNFGAAWQFVGPTRPARWGCSTATTGCTNGSGRSWGATGWCAGKPTAACSARRPRTPARAPPARTAPSSSPTTRRPTPRRTAARCCSTRCGGRWRSTPGSTGTTGPPRTARSPSCGSSRSGCRGGTDRRRRCGRRGRARHARPTSAGAGAGTERRCADEHLVRFEKQELGWTTVRRRDPAAADRWSWLVADQKPPWERPLAPARLSPGRVRRAFAGLWAGLVPRRRPPQPRGKSPGRHIGECPGPRPRHPVFRRGPPQAA